MADLGSDLLAPVLDCVCLQSTAVFMTNNGWP